MISVLMDRLGLPWAVTPAFSDFLGQLGLFEINDDVGHTVAFGLSEADANAIVERMNAMLEEAAGA